MDLKIKNKMNLGTIKDWNHSSGWGFIKGDDGYDYFLNISNVRRGTKVSVGSRVKFDICHTHKGDEAENVSLI